MQANKGDGGLKVALVGLGFGAEFVPIYRDHPAVAEVAICDPNPETLRSMGDRFGIARRFGDLEAVLASDFDAVHLVTPIPLHGAQTLAVLNAGKHCACTVPMALTLEELAAIVATTRRSGLTYMMMETAIYTREFLHVQGLMRQGAFGTISFARGSHLQDMEGWPDYWLGLPPHFYMTHAVAPALHLLGTRARRVHCLGSGRLPPERAARYGNPFPVETAIFRLADSDVALEVSRSLFQTVRPYTESFAIYGDRLGFEWAQLEEEAPYLFTLEPEPDLGRPGRGRAITSTRIEVPDRADLLPPAIARYTRASVHEDAAHLSFVQGGGHGGSHPHLVHEFLSAIVEGRPAAVNAATAAHWTAAGICAHQSALQEGAGVDIPDFRLD